MREATPDERQRALQLLANYPLFEEASTRSIETLLAAGASVVAEAHDLFLRENAQAQEMWFLLRGVVRIFHTHEDGREFTPKFMAAPNHFGDLELVAGFANNGQSVEALDEALLVRLPAAVLAELLAADHALCLGWMQGLARQFVYTIDADRHNVFLGVAGRAASVVLSYARAFSVREGNDQIEGARGLSRDQLARHVGSVRRVITRLLQDWEERGWIEIDADHLTIKNRQALENLTLDRSLGLMHRAETRTAPTKK